MSIFSRTRPPRAAGPSAATPAVNVITHPTVNEAPATAPAFVDLGVAPELAASLARGGILEPFPIQTATIPDTLAGRDVCGKARTGSGKTLAFGLPLLQIATAEDPALVLVPTRELAAQIVRTLAPLAAARGMRVTAAYGGAPMKRQVEALRSGVSVLVATPGRLNDLLERRLVSLESVRVVVIDEADQMADMGFLPQVERILKQIDGSPQTLLFSATLDGDVARLIERYQYEPVFHDVTAPDEQDDTTMLHRFVGVEEREKLQVAAAIVSGPERSLVFVRTQRGADRLARQFEQVGVTAAVLHGGLSQPHRDRALAWFRGNGSAVLVATNVAARGLHIDDIGIVVHYDPPEEARMYVHRSGRTARAGASGVTVTLVSPAQLVDVASLQRQMGRREEIVSMGPEDARLRDLVGWVPPERATWDTQRPGIPNSRSAYSSRPGRRYGGGMSRQALRAATRRDSGRQTSSASA